MTASPASSIDQARALLEQVTDQPCRAPGGPETGHALLACRGLFEGMLEPVQPVAARAVRARRSRDSSASSKVAALYQQAGAHPGWLRLVEEFQERPTAARREGLPALTRPPGGACRWWPRGDRQRGPGNTDQGPGTGQHGSANMSLLSSLLSGWALSVYDRAVTVVQNNVANAFMPGYASQSLT
jgi:hypothetical protein